MSSSLRVSQAYKAPAPQIQPVLAQPKGCSKISKAVSDFFLSFLSRLFTRIVLPATGIKASLAQRAEALQSTGGERVNFQTSDNASIDGMFIRGGQRKAILYVGGNGERWELSHPKFHAFRELVGDVSVLAFNPRGVGESKGTPNAPGLARDVHAAFHYLVNVEGIAPSDIVIFGHSLGGGYGAEGAALVQQDFPNEGIHYVSHNSFVDLKTEVLDIGERILPRCFKRPLLSLVQRLLVPERWQLDEIGAMQKLRGRKFVIVNKGDGVIPYRCSLYKGLKALKTPLNIPVLKMDSTYDPLIGGVDPQKKGQYQHCRDFSPWEWVEISSQLRQILQMPNDMPQLDPRINTLAQRSDHPKWARKYCTASTLFGRFRALANFHRDTPRDEINGSIAIIRSAASGILSKPFNGRTLNESLDNHWRHTMAASQDYGMAFRRALDRTHAEVILQFLSSQREDFPVDTIATMLDQLEAIPLNPQESFAGHYADYAELLYARTITHCRGIPELANQVDEPQFARRYLIAQRQNILPGLARPILEDLSLRTL